MPDARETFILRVDTHKTLGPFAGIVKVDLEKDSAEEICRGPIDSSLIKEGMFVSDKLKVLRSLFDYASVQVIEGIRYDF